MGCDIHIIVAYKEDGKDMEIIHDFDHWSKSGEDLSEDVIETWREEWSKTRLTRGRNYARFAALSGVRGDGPPANNWPPWAQHLPEYTDADLHSHTHILVKEALPIWLETEYPDESNRALLAKVDPYWFYFRVDPEKWNLDNVWVLISYDN